MWDSRMLEWLGGHHVWTFSISVSWKGAMPTINSIWLHCFKVNPVGLICLLSTEYHKGNTDHIAVNTSKEVKSHEIVRDLGN